MTAPTDPTPADFTLDQAVATAGIALVHAELAPVRDEQAIADAEANYKAALLARWPDA